jgi:hypothetical protein
MARNSLLSVLFVPAALIGFACPWLSTVRAETRDSLSRWLIAAARTQYCYACKVYKQGAWQTYRQTPWKNYCDQDDKQAMLDLRDQLRARGMKAKVVEKEREVNRSEFSMYSVSGTELTTSADGTGLRVVAAADKEYCYACKVYTRNRWRTYCQTDWKGYCDENDKAEMQNICRILKRRGMTAKVVEKEREVSESMVGQPSLASLPLLATHQTSLSKA